MIIIIIIIIAIIIIIIITIIITTVIATIIITFTTICRYISIPKISIPNIWGTGGDDYAMVPGDNETQSQIEKKKLNEEKAGGWLKLPKFLGGKGQDNGGDDNKKDMLRGLSEKVIEMEHYGAACCGCADEEKGDIEGGGGDGGGQSREEGEKYVEPDTDPCENMMGACDGVTSEKLYFIVFYPNMDSLTTRAEGDRMQMPLDPKKTLERHQKFYHALDNQLKVFSGEDGQGGKVGEMLKKLTGKGNKNVVDTKSFTAEQVEEYKLNAELGMQKNAERKAGEMTVNPTNHMRIFKRLGLLHWEKLDTDDIPEIDRVRDEDNYLPYINLFAEYKCEEHTCGNVDDCVNSHYQELLKPFSEVQLSKLCTDMLEDMDYSYYEYDSFLTMFKIHNEVETEAFILHYTFWDYPIHDVRDYFGEKVGMYFAFSKHYTLWGTILALISITIWIYMVNVGTNYLGTTTGANPSGHPFLALYSASIVVWAALMLKHWSLEQSKCSYIWGMSDFEKREKIRPAYALAATETEKNDIPYWEHDYFEKLGCWGGNCWGRYVIGLLNFLIDFVNACRHMTFGGVKTRQSPFDFDSYDYTDASGLNKSARMLISNIGSITLHAAMISCTFGVYYVRDLIGRDASLVVFGVRLAFISKYIATGLNVLQSIIFEPITIVMNEMLTNLENYRTETEHNDAMIIKSAMFSFVNAYVSFFYLAFIAGNQIAVLFGYNEVADCAGYDDCMEALSYNLIAVICTGLLGHIISEISPHRYLWLYFGECIIKAFDKNKEPNPANSNLVTDYNKELKVFADQYYRFQSLGRDASLDRILTINYSAFYKQFGYLLFFAPAFPLAAVIGWIANWIEMNGDMREFCKTLRTMPEGAQSIGSYEHCFHMLLLIAIPVNTAVVIFTMNALDPFLYYVLELTKLASYFQLFKIIAFFICQYILYSVVVSIRSLIPDQIKENVIGQERNRIVLNNLVLMDAYQIEKDDKDKIDRDRGRIYRQNQEIEKKSNTIEANKEVMLHMNKRIEALNNKVTNIDQEKKEIQKQESESKKEIASQKTIIKDKDDAIKEKENEVKEKQKLIDELRLKLEPQQNA